MDNIVDGLLGEAEYRMTQTTLTAAAAWMKDLPLAEFVATAERASTLAPLFDPTLYMSGADKLHAMINLARAGLAFQEATREFERRMQ